MKNIESPNSLATKLNELFPAFMAELEGEEISSYHQVILRLTPVISGYLQALPPPRTKEFCELVNAMVSAGGDQENAISTCLLEHASQVKVAKIIRPYLSIAAKQELR